MSALTDLARGRDCTIRVPGYCNFNTETTVPCHYSLTTISGRSLKSPDQLVAWGCSSCHEVVDFKVQAPEFKREEIRLMHAEGVFRTQYSLILMGRIK